MNYLLLRHLHITCVIVSGLGFLLRGLWGFFRPSMLERRWVRVFPHVVDTVLLASAVSLAVLSSQYPLAQNWLTAKVVGLLVYILCGTMALKHAKGVAARTLFFVAALTIYGYIVSVALTRNPLPFIS